MRVPKSFPPWIYSLSDYVSKKERKGEGEYRALLQGMEKHWNTFVAENAPPPTPKKPKKKKAADDMRRAVSGLKESLMTSPPDKSKKLVDSFMNEIRSLPEPLKEALIDDYKGIPSKKGSSTATTMKSTPNCIVRSDERESEDEKEVIVVPWDQVEEYTEDLYSTFLGEIEKLGIAKDHPLIEPVEQLYVIAKQATSQEE